MSERRRARRQELRLCCETVKEENGEEVVERGGGWLDGLKDSLLS